MLGILKMEWYTAVQSHSRTGVHETYAVSLAFTVALPFCRLQCRHTSLFGFNVILLTAVTV